MSKKKESGVALREGDNAAYRRWHKILAKIILWLFRVRVRHAEREPGEGASYLLCSNHISALDPVLIAAAVTQRQPHFMAKKELFRIPVLRSIIRAFGAYPVDRAGDVAAIKTSVSLLEMGNCVGMFPQGTRCAGRVPRETTDKVKNGAGLLCDKTHVTIWPVCLKTKNNRLRAFRRVELIFGEPIPYEALALPEGESGESKQQEYARISHIVFDRICDLYEENEGDHE